MVKLFTMVKDEVDIIRDWIVYHGSMFGWNNIYIIDNYSTDGTYEVIEDFRNIGINIYREHDYKEKGTYMKKLIDANCNGNQNLAFPLDIDEFIVYYENNQISIDKSLINNYIHNLPPCRVYKSAYIYPYLLKDNGYERATVECEWGSYSNYGSLAKSFIDKRYFQGSIDHGNHIHCDDYHMTKIALIHFHARNSEQMKKKFYNNVQGLGYNPNDLNLLKSTILNNENCMGNHHIKNQIKVLEKTFEMKGTTDLDTNSCIDIRPFKQRIIGGFF